MKSFISPLFFISISSFQELIRQRLLYNIFFVSLFLLFFGYLASLLVFGHQDRIMLHFGTMVDALSIFVVAVGAGARTLYVEMDQRTCYLPLSRAISRSIYFFGKWFGIILFTALNVTLLFALLWIGLWMTDGHLNVAFVQSGALIWCESLILSALAILISLFFRPGISAMICIAYLFLSHNHEQIDFLKQQDINGAFSILKWITPDGRALLMDTRVYYDLPLSAFEFASRFGYGLLWAVFFLLLGNAIFYRKNL
jgi:hypothetical protein